MEILITLHCRDIVHADGASGNDNICRTAKHVLDQPPCWTLS